MRTSRRPAATLGFALGLASVAMVTSGCNLVSPVASASYSASDGSNVQLGSVRLNNFLVVSGAQGKPGVLVGAVSTDGAQPVDVQITVLSGQSTVGQGTVTAKPGELATVGSGEGAKSIDLSNVPVAPGANLTLRASTSDGGKDVVIPVLAPVGHYESVAPSASK